MLYLNLYLDLKVKFVKVKENQEWAVKYYKQNKLGISV